MGRLSFLSGPRDTGAPLWHEDGVDHRQIRGRVAVEDKLGLERPVVHRREPREPRAKNSVNARVTRAEIVLPDSRARSRTRTANTAGSLTVNTTVASGDHHPTSPRGVLDIPTGLTRRTAEPLRQDRHSLGHRHPRIQQLHGRVDPLGVLTSTNTTTRHAIKILLDMSNILRDTPRSFQPPITQRDIKAEVAQCVGGVAIPPYEQRWVMRSARGLLLVGVVAAVGRCA